MRLLKKEIKTIFPLLLVFLLVSSLVVVFGKVLIDHRINHRMLIAGNIILFSITALSFFLYRKALLAPNTQSFLRHVYTGMMIKFFMCIAATFIYILSSGNAVNKPALFTLMFLYLMYTFLEMALLMKQARQIKQNMHA